MSAWKSSDTPSPKMGRLGRDFTEREWSCGALWGAVKLGSGCARPETRSESIQVEWRSLPEARTGLGIADETVRVRTGPLISSHAARTLGSSREP